MSYSIQEAKQERITSINKAIKEEDVEALYNIADLVKGEGDDELAFYLRNKARKIQKAEWAYDESIGN